MKATRRCFVIAGTMLLATGVFAQVPDCSLARAVVADTTTLLNDKYVCATRAQDTWQELHKSGGALWDWKLGPGSTMDRTKLMGSWSGSATDGVVTHSYNGGGGSYTWRVCSIGGS